MVSVFRAITALLTLARAVSCASNNRHLSSAIQPIWPGTVKRGVSPAESEFQESICFYHSPIAFDRTPPERYYHDVQFRILLTGEEALTVDQSWKRCDPRLVEHIKEQCLDEGAFLSAIPDRLYEKRDFPYKYPMVWRSPKMCKLSFRVRGYNVRRGLITFPNREATTAFGCITRALECIYGKDVPRIYVGALPITQQQKADSQNSRRWTRFLRIDIA